MCRYGLKICRIICLILVCAVLCMLCACTGGGNIVSEEPTPTPQTEQAEPTPEPTPEPVEQEDTMPEEQSKEQEDIAEGAGVTPEVKEAMDSYEAFFDKYIEFMQVYEESESTAELMLEYADYMAQYAEMTEKIEAIDEDSLSTADQMYYIEVMSRVSQKLLAASEEE